MAEPENNNLAPVLEAVFPGPLTVSEKLAWGNALVKTGTEHLDLAMVRQGRQALKEAETAAPPS